MICSSDLFDPDEQPLVRIAIAERDGKITGKLGYGGATSNFDATGSFDGPHKSRVGRPERDGDFYYLMSDSDTVGFGPQPFKKESNKIALELLRAPLP